MKNRLVKKDEQGNFWVNGVALKALPKEVYCCILKLKDYEDTELSPSEVEQLIDFNDATITELNKLQEEKGERSAGCGHCNSKECSKCVFRHQHADDEPCNSCKGYKNFKSEYKYCKYCGKKLGG